ncbi:MAG TPA: hypothetical protein PKC24_08800 [Cyclobacteriaceae bacterium]|nr:hypothetical protein [Cyclobacteriaceae bacterium]
MQEETKSGFLFRNLLKGLLWFIVIITVFILVEDYVQENFQTRIIALQNKPLLLYLVFFISEVVFGIVPPEFFMMVWILQKVSIPDYILSLSFLTILSYISGVIGYFIGKNFSKTEVYKKLHMKFLYQYDHPLLKYGGYLVFVGAVSPLPFSAVCMLAGSVNFNYRNFLLISVARILRFAVYGYLVWSTPNLF